MGFVKIKIRSGLEIRSGLAIKNKNYLVQPILTTKQLKQVTVKGRAGRVTRGLGHNGPGLIGSGRKDPDFYGSKNLNP